MNYIALLKNLCTEVKISMQHKRLGTALTVILIIALLPFYALLGFSILAYLALTFFYNACASVTNALETWIDERKKDLHPAGEAVFIFCTTPFIFFCNILLSFFSVWYYFLWFFMQVVAFFATSGSTRWRPFIYNAYKDLKKKSSWKITTNLSAASIFTIVAFLLFVVLAVLYLLLNFSTENILDLYNAYSIVSPLYYLFVLIATPLIFKKKEVAAPVAADPVVAEVEEPQPKPEEPVIETI